MATCRASGKRDFLVQPLVRSNYCEATIGKPRQQKITNRKEKAVAISEAGDGKSFAILGDTNLGQIGCLLAFVSDLLVPQQ